ncbi:MAG TPA: phosphate ABC transporter permease subunit PstC [Streptosporangiaceae bacterium]|nr:phosphate ABC transporter permease subunit PstC [Streptosporangiaceae bacterium]
MSAAISGPGGQATGPSPRRIFRGLMPADRVFFGVSWSVGTLVLIICGSIGLFLLLQLIPTVRAYGLHFFTQVNWDPYIGQIGVAAALLGTFEVALVAIVVSVPLALLTALYITEYAPQFLKSGLVSLIDLMAAIPSIIYGLWGFFLLTPRAEEVSRWLNTYLGWFPLFKVAGANPRAAVVSMASTYYGSVAIAGVVVAMMVIPMACAVMRGVFAQAPPGEREGALALGATKWGVIRTVVLPFGRGGIIGGTMLGLGRALGETIAVLTVIAVVFDINFRILRSGTITVASLIADRWNEATPGQLSALLAAGFVLFVITMAVNFIAAIFVTRSRSGASTEI